MFPWEILSCLSSTIGKVLLALLLAKLWARLTVVMCREDTRMDGKVVLITGGSAGIGFETARDLADRGAEVVFTARDMKKGEKARGSIRRLTRNGKVHLRHLDVSSLRQVRQFAKYATRDFPRIHVLINNAGTIGDHGLLPSSAGVRKLSEEGHELAVATNYLGHFLLTELMLPCVRRAAEEERKKGSSWPCRIINVSSFGHVFGTIDVENLDLDMEQEYANSKLAQVHHASELHRRFRARGVNIQSASLYPGLVRTEIFREVSKGWYTRAVDATFWWLGKSPEEGAQTSIHLAVTEHDLGGRHYVECAPAPWFMRARGVGDEEKEKSLYDQTAAIVEAPKWEEE